MTDGLSRPSGFTNVNHNNLKLKNKKGVINMSHDLQYVLESQNVIEVKNLQHYEPTKDEFEHKGMRAEFNKDNGFWTLRVFASTGKREIKTVLNYLNRLGRKADVRISDGVYELSFNNKEKDFSYTLENFALGNTENLTYKTLAYARGIATGIIAEIYDLYDLDSMVWE